MAIKEISSQSAIDHKKKKTHNTHVYSEFVLSFYLYIFKYGDWFFEN